MSKESKTKKKDLFAEIARLPQSVRQLELVAPLPPELPELCLPTRKNDSQSVFKACKKIDTPARLKRELDRQRKIYAKFEKNLAPRCGKKRISFSLKKFDWREETKTDQQDFQQVLNGKGKWERVQIPHYGGPLGRAVTYYRTKFDVSKAMLEKGFLFVCFKGVDYKSHVFINSTYVGSHEGFFAPFDFGITNALRLGENILLVKVENDAICMGNSSWGEDGDKYEGDKIYAATGPGYDDPQVGWHHCPPGMGIYQEVFVEARSSIYINDIFVRPILSQNRAEAWIEVYNCERLRQNVKLEISVFGQNFRTTVFRDRRFDIAYAGPKSNLYRLFFELPAPRIWQQDTPWLYQIQVKVFNEQDKVQDVQCRQFGMRSFLMDEESKVRGRFYLNGHQIRLRGANSMGHLQQCVMKKDWDQLRDAILLAKICHMNFLRLTQRPVQPEIYEFCDKLGMMTQTDLPLFAVLRRSQFCEAIRQAEEMERLVRNHPCNIMVSYINEPFADGWKKPHRHLVRSELEDFFVTASKAVLLANPDRVIKPVDGDYDPPSSGLPDNHCYCGWYSGHGVDIGKLNRGYWQKVKPDWYYGCGEFGSEGLDYESVMRQYYPKEWLPLNSAEEVTWTPDSIVKAQTGRFHYLWFETQHKVADWIAVSQKHQAWVTRLMTEAFRRDNRMNSFAIHLFIDAFPAGWMKAIMDFKQQPKPAYFAYRDALTPLMVNLRSDRQRFFSGEEIVLEAWICNDTESVPKNLFLHYQYENDGKVLFANRKKALIKGFESEFQGFFKFVAPQVKERSSVEVRLGLLNQNGKVFHDTSVILEIFPKPVSKTNGRAVIMGSRNGKAAGFASNLGLKRSFSDRIKFSDLIIIDDFNKFLKKRRFIESLVSKGSIAIFLELPKGTFEIGGSEVKVDNCSLGARNFVSRGTGHPLVKEFDSDDFKLWFDSKVGYVTPLLETSIVDSDFDAILTSRNGDWVEDWGETLVVAEKKYGNGYFRICQIKLEDRLSNPVALLFARKILGME
jgi:hypothetical protein